MRQLFYGGENFSFACLSHFNGLDIVCAFMFVSGHCSSGDFLAGVNTRTLKTNGQWSEWKGPNMEIYNLW